MFYQDIADKVNTYFGYFDYVTVEDVVEVLHFGYVDDLNEETNDRIAYLIEEFKDAKV